MGRMPRILVKNAVYLLTPGGDNNAPIFKEDGDYSTYIELLARYKKMYNFRLFAFCLVPTSISLLIEPSGSVMISQIMHDTNSNYTKYFNRKYNIKGHLFQERYRMVLIEKEPNLLKMTAYVHLRPKLLGLASDISGYQYSSYKAYLIEESKTGIAESNIAETKGLEISNEAREALGYLKGGTYQELVGVIEAGESKELDAEVAKKTIIGSDEFVRDVKSRIEAEKQRPEEEAALFPKGALQPQPQHELQTKPLSEPQPEPQPEPEPQLAPLSEPQDEPQPEVLSEPQLEPQPEPLPEPQPEPQAEPQPEPQPEALSEPQPQPKPRRAPSNIIKLIAIGLLAALAVASVTLSLQARSARLKESMEREIARKDLEFRNRLSRDRKALYRALSEKVAREKASYQAAVKRIEAEKEKLRGELFKTKLEAASNEWLGSAKEKMASELDKIITHSLGELSNTGDAAPHDYYLRKYSFVKRKTDIIKKDSSQGLYKGYVNIDKILSVEKSPSPDMADNADLLFTATTPIKLNFEYRGDRFIFLNKEEGRPFVWKGWK